MTHLGVLSPEPPAEPVEADTFEWFGDTIRTHPAVSELPFLDLLEKAEEGEIDETDPRSGVMVKQLFRRYIHVEDFDRFWELATENGQGTDELIVVVYRILELKAERSPTKPSSASSGGRKHTAARSRGGSSRKATKSRSTRARKPKEPVDQRQAATLRVIRSNLSEGRPDLALHVAEADLAQRQQAGTG
jgi:hypothetical protein